MKTFAIRRLERWLKAGPFRLAVLIPFLFLAWAGCALLDVMGQRTLFYQQGEEELFDFFMPKMCLEQGYAGRPSMYTGWTCARNGKPIEINEQDVVWSDWYTDGKTTTFITGCRDKVYPAFALLPFKLFPATRWGGYLWSGLAGCLFIAVLCWLGRSAWPVLLALTMPFLFNLERGNPVWLSALYVAVFLAWWDDKTEWKRLLAAAALAAAGSLKIAPFVLGLLYLTKWRWRPVLLCASLSIVFLLVPWFFVPDGFGGLPVMIRNAAEHAQFVQRGSDFGFVQLWRTFRLVTGQDVQNVWTGMRSVAIVSQLAGVCLLAAGTRRRDLLLLVGGMVLAAGNMYYYAALYLFPVLVLESGRDGMRRSLGVCEAALWLMILSPWQIVCFGHSANQTICNVSLMALLIFRLWKGGSRTGHPVIHPADPSDRFL